MGIDETTPKLELEDIQSIILRRRPSPYCGCHVLLKIEDASQGRELLNKLRPYVLSAAEYGGQDTWMALVITYAGLVALEVPESSLASFPAAFRDGMAARSSIVGDTGESSPERWDRPYGTGDIHVAVTLLSTTHEIWQANLEKARAVLASLPGVTLLAREDFEQSPGQRTPFGYKDGISFPNIIGNRVSPIADEEEPIAAGEFIFGYPGEAGRMLAMPQPALLGRNGTFVSFRKLHSKVAAFRRFLKANATPTMSAELLAAKMVGRWPSGAPLMLAPEQDAPELGSDLQQMNNFKYAQDPKGLRCPIGAHIRRMNPRDTELEVMTNVKIHRIIRHGTIYGPPLPENVTEDDGKERGVFFIFLNAKAPDTFEFLKREWINSGNFLGLGAEEDPIAGGHTGTGMFTIPMRPIRRRLQGLERFTVTRGGEYGFLPSLSALRWLASSPAERATTTSVFREGRDG
jgi:Dyp-type peroxidase family